jgi:hypothetical protein
MTWARSAGDRTTDRPARSGQLSAPQHNLPPNVCMAADTKTRYSA